MPWGSSERHASNTKALQREPFTLQEACHLASVIPLTKIELHPWNPSQVWPARGGGGLCHAHVTTAPYSWPSPCRNFSLHGAAMPSHKFSSLILAGLAAVLCCADAAFRKQCPCFFLQARLKAIKKAHGSKKLGDVTVDMALGGMRGIPVSRGAYQGRRVIVYMSSGDPIVYQRYDV